MAEPRFARAQAAALCPEAQGILGIVLAGGRSSRFDADKAAADLCGQTILSRVCKRAAPQVNALLISRNDGDSPAGFELQPDDHPGQGPLAGILAGLGRARSDGFSLLATFTCDAPFLPEDCVARLRDGLLAMEADYCVAHHGGNEHRAVGLWRVRCLPAVSEAFSNGLRSLHGVAGILIKAVAEFPAVGDGPGGDAFFNINTVEDLSNARRWLVSHPGRRQHAEALSR